LSNLSVAFARSCGASRAIHVVSQVHSIIIVTAAFYTILTETSDLELDKAYGWNDSIGFVHGVATGYFIWDSLDAIINFVDFGFIVHGIACTLVYGLSYVSILCLIPRCTLARMLIGAGFVPEPNSLEAFCCILWCPLPPMGNQHIFSKYSLVRLCAAVSPCYG